MKKKNLFIIGALIAFFAFVIWSFGRNAVEISTTELETALEINNKGEAVGKFKGKDVENVESLVANIGGSIVDINGKVVFSDKRFINFKTTVPRDYFSTIVKVKWWLHWNPKFIDAANQYTFMGFLLAMFYQLAPILIFFALLFYLNRRLFKKDGGGGFNPFGMGSRSTNRSQTSKVRFSDVAGIKEEKEELFEIIDYLRDPSRYRVMGANAPKGILLIGDPGTGKTLLARALAGEAHVPFFSISGSEFEEVFVGVGASRVREIFSNAKKNAPSIIFIDEMDAVGGKRPVVSMSNAGEQTLNQLLVEMDGFEENSGVIIVGATNRWDNLDHALLRPGRFDRQIYISLPTPKEREEILKIHARGKKISDEVNFSYIAKRTAGLSGAQLANIINEAALLAVRINKNVIGNEEIEEGIDRAIGGIAKRSRVMTVRDKEIVAYHEAGHAVVGWKVAKAQVVQRVTIVPRGHAGGYTVVTPKEETYFTSYEDIVASITGYLAGKASEEIMFGKTSVTTGSADDLMRATLLANDAVTKFGMTPTWLSSYKLESSYEMYTRGGKVSDEMLTMINKKVEGILEEAYQNAKKVIIENKDVLDLIAKSLIKVEMLTAEQIKWICDNRKVIDEQELVQSQDSEEVNKG